MSAVSPLAVLLVSDPLLGHGWVDVPGKMTTLGNTVGKSTAVAIHAIYPLIEHVQVRKVLTRKILRMQLRLRRKRERNSEKRRKGEVCQSTSMSLWKGKRQANMCDTRTRVLLNIADIGDNTQT